MEKRKSRNPIMKEKDRHEGGLSYSFPFFRWNRDQTKIAIWPGMPRKNSFQTGITKALTVSTMQAKPVHIKREIIR